MSITRKLAVQAAALTSASFALAAPVWAAPPFTSIEIDEEETFEFALCDTATSVQSSETGTLTIRPKGKDGLSHYTLKVTGHVVNTNLATGRSVRLERNLIEQDVRVVAGEGDLISISGHSIVHENDYNSDGSLAFRTYGRQAWVVVVDTQGTESDSDDEVVSEDYGDITGRNDRADVDFCAWYLDQTG